MLTVEALDKILANGSEAECVAFFDGAPEDARRSFVPHLVDLARAADAFFNNVAVETTIILPSLENSHAAMSRFMLAMLACESFEQVKRLDHIWCDDESVHTILVSRRSKWVDSFVNLRLSASKIHWPLVRACVLKGICAAPTSDDYILGMIEGIYGWRRQRPLRDGLLADPRLLENEFWKLFEIEGGGDTSLAANDKYCHVSHRWDLTLAALAAEDRLPRARLLDASPDALARDFAQFRAGWFSRLSAS